MFCFHVKIHQLDTVRRMKQTDPTNKKVFYLTSGKDPSSFIGINYKNKLKTTRTLKEVKQVNQPCTHGKSNTVALLWIKDLRCLHIRD